LYANDHYKIFGRQGSEAEMKELLGWLRNKENRLIFQSVQLDWKSSLVKTGFPAESRESWLQLQEKLAQKKLIRLSEFQNKQFFFRIAVIFIFAVSLAVPTWFVSQKFQPGNEVFTRVVAGSGQYRKLNCRWNESGSIPVRPFRMAAGFQPETAISNCRAKPFFRLPETKNCRWLLRLVN
jgi:hypothetical protein